MQGKVVLPDEILEDFIRLMENIRDNKFEIGDRLIDLVLLHLGDKAGVINQVAAKLNISASLLYDYYRISEKWAPIYRQMYQSLDWTIYRNADPLEDKELLERCMDEGWNASRFKEEKYPAMKEPDAVLQRIKTIVQRYYMGGIKEEMFEGRLNIILVDLKDLLQEMKDYERTQ